jgi:transposase
VTKLLRTVRPHDVVGTDAERLALEMLADVRRRDRDLAATKARIAEAVTTSKTSLLELHGVGPIVAGLVLAHVGDPARFATKARFGRTTRNDSDSSMTGSPS